MLLAKQLKVFTNLALGWTDGINYVPLLSHLIASNKEKISFRRLIQVTLMTELLELNADSQLVKSNLQFKLEKGSSKSFSQKELLKKINGGKLNKAKLITSVIDYTNKDLKVRLVFVKARNSTDWICIVSTDIDLSPERIIELYGIRWSIEVAFKAQKSYLGLKSECQAHDFDTCNAFMVIANIRLQLMEFNRRHDNDPRSIGELFYSARSELTAITFAEALQTLLLLIDNIAVTLDAAGCICKGKLAKK